MDKSWLGHLGLQFSEGGAYNPLVPMYGLTRSSDVGVPVGAVVELRTQGPGL